MRRPLLAETDASTYDPCAWKRSLLAVIVRHVCNRASANCKFMFYGLLHQSNITFTCSQQRCERAASSAVVLSSSSPPSDSVRLPCGSPPRSVLSCDSVKSTQTGIGSVSARLVLERRDRSFAFCKLCTHSEKFLGVPAQPHPLVMELRLHLCDCMFDPTLASANVETIRDNLCCVCLLVERRHGRMCIEDYGQGLKQSELFGTQGA